MCRRTNRLAATCEGNTLPSSRSTCPPGGPAGSAPARPGGVGRFAPGRLGAGEQVGAGAAGALGRLRPAPAGDGAVVAGAQDRWDVEAAVGGGAGVLGVLEQAGTARRGEGLLPG